ncbi:hypothetical protein Sjap_002789 [Stephania japonica]|uniref:Berberine/berberine-like domain-containing protein n=1 Tax=Stephania japonica TaxID=461633 RepID=A0AAP0KPV5_9MAGN
MGEDLFWAVRGGGGASFGVIISWKIRLVHVPPTVTVFTVHKTLEQGAAKLIHRWQYIAHKLHEDLFIRVIVQIINGEKTHGAKSLKVGFNSIFLGSIEDLIPLMNESFPELGLTTNDCTEMTWIESILYFVGYYPQGTPIDVLLNRTNQDQSFFKAKSDFVKTPIPEKALKRILKWYLKEQTAFMIMDPFGGRMSEISEFATPFPHRDGNLYNIQYLVKWVENGDKAPQKHLHWIRKLYRYMSPYVSNSPRAAYLNYRDLDLGTNGHGSNISLSRAVVWGRKYFNKNFERLALVKGKVDPDNFFRNEQSIPPLFP